MTTPATAPTTPEAAPKAPSKMSLCKPLFEELTAEGAILPEGKTARATFIARAQAEDIGLTAAGAATYWQNLTSKAAGGKLYPHGAKPKAKDEAPAAEPAAEPAATSQEPGEEQETAGAHGNAEEDLSHLEG